MKSVAPGVYCFFLLLSLHVTTYVLPAQSSLSSGSSTMMLVSLSLATRMRLGVPDANHLPSYTPRGSRDLTCHSHWDAQKGGWQPDALRPPALEMSEAAQHHLTCASPGICISTTSPPARPPPVASPYPGSPPAPPSLSAARAPPAASLATSARSPLLQPVAST